MIVWLLAPLMLATKPTPQASCSRAGSYNPCAAGRIWDRAESVMTAPLAAIWFRTVVGQPTTLSGRTNDSTGGALSVQALNGRGWAGFAAMLRLRQRKQPTPAAAGRREHRREPMRRL